MTLADSPSETVRRHASTFTRWNPVVRERDPEPYVLPPAPVPTAVEVGLDALGDGRSKRVQAARAAETGGWSWRAHAATAPDGGTSVVMRFAMNLGLPWEARRAVAYWSARPDRPLAFVAAYRWRTLGGRIEDGVEPIAARDLLAFLRDPPALPPRGRAAVRAAIRRG